MSLLMSICETIFPLRKNDAYQRINSNHLQDWVIQMRNYRAFAREIKGARGDRCLSRLPRIVTRSRGCEGCNGGSSLLVRHSVVRDDHFRHTHEHVQTFARAIRFPASQIFPRIPRQRCTILFQVIPRSRKIATTFR